MSRSERVISALKGTLAVAHLELVDESHQHSGNGQETHLKLTLVSPEFVDKSRVARQQMVYRILDAELKSGLHALTMRTFTPEEWRAAGGVDSSVSPPCAGGSKHD